MIHDHAGAAPRNLRLKPEVTAELALFRSRLTVRHRLGLITAENVSIAYRDALAQVLRSDAALMPDDREWTPVRCRDCGHQTSVVKDTSSWECRCKRGHERQAFVDAIGPDGRYLLDDHAMVHRENAAPTPLDSNYDLEREVAAAGLTA